MKVTTIARRAMMWAVRRTCATGPTLGTDERIDARYLTRLSDDAVPALVENVDRLEGWRQSDLRSFLKERYEQLRTDGARNDWRAFHVSHWLGYRSLALWRGAQP